MNSRRAVLLSLSLLLASVATLAQIRTQEAVSPVELPVATGPRVALETSLGRIVVELYPEKSPRTVANFLSYVRDGHYNGTIFHRVIPDLLIQGGAYTPDLQHKPERAPITNESNNGLSNLRGTLAAARRASENDSARAQFFINTIDNRQLDFRGDANPSLMGYCVFGRVVEGMDVLDKIRAVPTTGRTPFPADVPTTAVLLERALVIES